MSNIPIFGGVEMLALLLAGSSLTIASVSWYKSARQNKPLWLLQDAYQGLHAQAERGAKLDTWEESGEGRAKEIAELTQQEAKFNRRVSAIALTGMTAALHVFSTSPILSATGLGVLNGLGALVLLSVHLTVPQRESYLRYTRSAMLGYVSLTSVGYFVLKGAQGLTDPFGIATQLVDFALIGVLWDDHRASTKELISSLSA